MQARFSGDDAGLRSAVAFVNALDSDAEFWAGIIAHPAFAFATITPAMIAARLRGERRPIFVQLWKPRFERRLAYVNTVAVTNPHDPFRLHYHVAFLANSPAQKVNTIVHEYIHNVDDHDHDPGEQMGHGDNDWRGKENSPPYWIGEWAQDLYELRAGVAAALAPAAPIGPTEVHADEEVAG
ncbi:hypothetical protein [Novosphingobium lentum]|uniref:hypothetical protein n=1 Tax=Novosphingobium lentum TaxID=145287 RepID=UPI00082D1437|nr:hypothetical protein [Novosphingobium lentum]